MGGKKYRLRTQMFQKMKAPGAVTVPWSRGAEKAGSVRLTSLPVQAVIGLFIIRNTNICVGPGISP